MSLAVIANRESWMRRGIRPLMKRLLNRRRTRDGSRLQLCGSFWLLGTLAAIRCARSRVSQHPSGRAASARPSSRINSPRCRSDWPHTAGPTIHWHNAGSHHRIIKHTHTHTHALTLQEPTSKLWYWMVAAALWRGARRFSRVRAPLRLNYRKIAIHFILIPAAICYAFLRGFVQEYICIRLISRAFFFLRVLCWH